MKGTNNIFCFLGGGGSVPVCMCRSENSAVQTISFGWVPGIEVRCSGLGTNSMCLPAEFYRGQLCGALSVCLLLVLRKYDIDCENALGV